MLMFFAFLLYFLLALASDILTGVLYVLGTSIRERFHRSSNVESQGIETTISLMRVLQQFTTGEVLILIAKSAVLAILCAILPWPGPIMKVLGVFSLSTAFTWHRLDSWSVNISRLLKRKR